MTNDDTAERTESTIDRRRLLQVSSASLATGTLAGKVTADPEDGRRGPPSIEEKPPREPDVRIVDNSASDSGVMVRFRSIEPFEVADAEGASVRRPRRAADVDRGDRPVVAEKTLPTKGIRHPDFEDRREFVDVGLGVTEDVDVQGVPDRILKLTEPIDEARAQIDRIDDVSNALVAVEVEHEGSSDFTYINVLENGAAAEETAVATVDENGEVLVRTEIACH